MLLHLGLLLHLGPVITLLPSGGSGGLDWEGVGRRESKSVFIIGRARANKQRRNCYIMSGIFVGASILSRRGNKTGVVQAFFSDI